MKPKTKLTLLALLAASLLSACGSSGGKAPETMSAPQPNPQSESQQQGSGSQGTTDQAQPPAAPESEPIYDPMAEMPEVKADKEVLSRLSVHTKDGVVTDVPLTLSLDSGSGKIQLDLQKPHTFHGNGGKPFIETLRDSDDMLVGYYAYAGVNKTGPDPKANGEQVSELVSYFLQYADESKKQIPAALGNVTYKGQMLYQYNSQPGSYEVADVTATYYGADKTLGMRIEESNGGFWTLHESNRLSGGQTARAKVEDDGSVLGSLLFRGAGESKDIANGHFIGGFYGKNGSVLTGKAGLEDREKGWQGVVGATAEKP